VSHCAPDQLALAALAEPLPDDDAAHLAGCPTCRNEVSSLRQAVEVLSVPALRSPAPTVPPPPRVWNAIAASTGVGVSPRPTAPEPVPAPHPRPAARTDPFPADPPAPVDLATRRRRGPGRSPRWWLAVAASLVVGLGVGGAAVALTSGRTDDGAVVAAAALDPLPDRSATGRATVRSEGGSRVLDVALQAPALSSGYYEVWLMETNAKLMVPVGVVRTGDTQLPLPDGLDLSAYPLVDVSVEPLDGNPTHSGLSVARGELAG
jgi:anti-sigma-K factor RskA